MTTLKEDINWLRKNEERKERERDRDKFNKRFEMDSADFEDSMKRDLKKREFKVLHTAVSRMDILCDLSIDFGRNADKKRAYLYDKYQEYLDEFIKDKDLRHEVRTKMAKDSTVLLVKKMDKYFVRFLCAMLLAIILGIKNYFKFGMDIKVVLSIPQIILYIFGKYNFSKSSKIEKLIETKKQEAYENIKDADLDEILYKKALVKAKEHFGCTKEEYAEYYIKASEEELDSWIRIWGDYYTAIEKMRTRYFWMDIYKDYFNRR